MKLLQVKLLFLLLIVAVNGLTQIIDVPDIKYVSIDPETNEIIVAWNASTTSNIAYCSVEYILLPGFGNPMIDIYFNREDSIRFSLDTISNTVIPTDVIDRALGFAVTAHDINDKGSNSLNRFHTTMFLTGTYLSCPNRISLEWTKYTTGVLIDVPVISYSIVGVNGSGKKVLQTLDANTTSVELLQEATTGFECYFIEAKFTSTDGNDYVSRSNKVCVTKNEIDKPDFMTIDYVSNNTNNRIALSVSIDTTSSISNYQLYTAQEIGGPFEKIDSISLQSPIAETTILELNSVGTNIIAYYKVYAFDNCNNLLDSSNIACNIVLDVDDSAPFVSELAWNNYVGWSNDLISYEIQRKTNIAEYTVISMNLPGDINFTDNIELLSQNNSLFCYRIIANKAGTSSIESISNEVCVDKIPRVYIPNTIRPMSDIEINKYFRVFSSFLTADGFSLSVYDRWGKKLFHSNNPEESWDGTVNGNYVQQGTYIYNLEYKGADGKTVEEKAVLNVVY